MKIITLFEKRVKESTLTKTEKKIADYFLENLNNICFMTATSISIEVGVSDTSIIRFIRSLGYSSYSDFQREMKEEMVRQINDAANSMSPANKYKNTIESLSKNNLIDNLMEQTFKNLQKTFEQLNYEAINEAANILVKSKHKYIIGFRGSASLASFMGGKLRYLLPNISICTHADSELIEQIIDIEKGDCILLYSFPIHTKLCTSAIDIAHSKNANIIVVTDKITSPIAAKADIVLPTAVDGLGFCNSYVAPLCLNDLILLVISDKTKNEAKDRVNDLEKYIEMHELH